MKKLAIFLALLLVPMTAFGMDTISDSDLDAVTGQAGVSIALNSIQIQNSGGTTSYGDPDSGNWLSITGDTKLVTKTIGFHAKYNPWDMTAAGGTQTNQNFDALTIDIVNIANVDGWNLMSLVVATDVAQGVEGAAVKISLPDVIQIESTDAQIRTIWLGSSEEPNDTVAEELIQIYSTAGTTRIIGADMGANFSAYGTCTPGDFSYGYFSGANTTLIIGAHD
jgi:hypothetical protein